MADGLNGVAISRLTLGLVEHVAGIDVDIGLKIAALRAAADTLSQAVAIAYLTATLAGHKGPGR